MNDEKTQSRETREVLLTIPRERYIIQHSSWYQSQVSILGLVGYGPTTFPLRHSDLNGDSYIYIYLSVKHYVG